ncbi:heavy-metal-associated domain-containing protein [Blastococcus sp. Marseille-P5729]|uniref:heavy-metal-associated domain-containing protein n=1 Tax=Blastococcus sp. Marseille-P5729 TaxID=2086582 RepID=UPI000D102233|nr:copper ion binding protein [Blastococcus sp. Marseille-P5729]
MATQNFTVTGMTCGHCVASVTEEVSEVDGVQKVDVQLDGGTLTVEGDADSQAIIDAVSEAGYEAVAV